MKILLIGANGQLGKTLIATAPANITLNATSHLQLNICDKEAVLKKTQQLSPNIIINAAAYTAVDQAETNSNTSFAVNRDGTINVAVAAKKIGAKLIYISTDYVFDGKNKKPYTPADITNPLNIYGKSKLQAEQHATQILGKDVAIIRTCWLYSPYGNNFLLKILRLLNEKKQLNVIDDQFGTPTSTHTLAQMLWTIIKTKNMSGIWHYSDAGQTSWYHFALAIQEGAYKLGLLSQKVIINPIHSDVYSLPAKRPHYSVLDTTATRESLNLPTTHWQEQLLNVLKALKR